MNRKVLLVTNIPTPYRVPLFNVMSQMFSSAGFTLNVVFCVKGYKRRKWKNPLHSANFEYSILKSLKGRLGEEVYIYLPLNLFKVLSTERPVVIISGGFSFQTSIICLFHLVTKTPYIIWSGEIPKSKTSTSFFRKLLRGILIKNASAFIAYGTEAGKYLKSLDCKKHIFYGWNTVDTEFFAKKVNELRKNKAEISEPLTLSLSHKGRRKNVNIIVVGYLVKRKGFDYVLKALKIVKEKNEEFFLHVVGDGSEKRNLEKLTQNLGLSENVQFWGYKQRAELLKFFAIADSFVFPSLFDIWGLVTIEAMSCRLPVIASKYAGSTCDLIQDGVNGFVINPYDIEAMAQKIQILIENPELRKKMGKNAQRTIREGFTLKHSAQRFLEAIKYTLSKS